MRRYIVRGLAWAALGFVVLWGLRLGAGYLERPNGHTTTVRQGAVGDGFELEKRNYASSKVMRNTADQAGNAVMAAMDQKYERVADVRARARAFDDDEAALRAAAAEHAGVVQLEHKQGLRGARVLHLAVGVPPDRFDAFVAAARQIGVETYLTIDKQDRTNAWRELEAKRATLEATRASLVALKQQSGSIQERTALEDRILEIHEQLQTLGVSLGDFDQVNELCTVKLTLAEESTTRVATGPVIPLWQRARVAFEWAVPMYLRLLGALLSGVLIALVGSVVAERLRPWSKTLAQAAAQPRSSPPPSSSERA
jgi:hypothetical protein